MVACLGILGAGTVDALLAGRSLTGVFSKSGRIAVVDVQKDGVRLYRDEGERSIGCGYAYEALPVQDLSGSGPFSFVVAEATEPLPTGRYLVFAEPSAEAVALEPNGSGADHRGRCWQERDYFTFPDLQMVFAVSDGCRGRAGDYGVEIPGNESILEVLDLEGFADVESAPSTVCVSDIRRAVDEILAGPKQLK